MTALPYWTGDYVHLGAFRVTSFAPDQEIQLEAYPGFFLGRLLADALRIRMVRDQNTLFAQTFEGPPASAETAYHLGVRKGVKALQDWWGGMSGHYGSYSRNAYLWDVE